MRLYHRLSFITLLVFWWCQPIWAGSFQCQNIYRKSQSASPQFRVNPFHEMAESLSIQLNIQYRSLPKGLLTGEIHNLALKILKEKNIDYNYIQVSGKKVIQILPSEKTEINKIAKKLFENFNTFCLFSASELVNAESPTFVTTDNHSNKTLYFMGLETLINNKPAREESYLHELRHIYNIKLTNDGNPPLIYGRIKAALKGTLPGEHQNTGYDRDLSIDEIQTYHSQIKQALINLKKILRYNVSKTQKRSLIQTQLLKLQDAALQMNIVTEKIFLAFDALKESKLKPIQSPHMNPSLLIADFFVQIGNNFVEIEIPIQKDNFDLLSHKIESIYHTSRLLSVYSHNLFHALASEITKIEDSDTTDSLSVMTEKWNNDLPNLPR